MNKYYFLFCAILAGVVCKLYDDVNDNQLLKQYKKPTLMEALKGLHFITCTILSIESPIFFLILYSMNALNRVTNRKGFSEPYERSGFYSFAILFLFIDYSKIVALSKYDYGMICLYLLGSLVESKISKEEISKFKMLFRFAMSAIMLVFINIFTLTDGVIYISLYNIGYTIISSLVQYYSLYVHPPQDNIVDIESAIQETKQPDETTNTETINNV
jgi:hypothetical protein